MPTISRRGFLALGGTGAAGAVLAACGSEEDPREDGRDGELLAAALAAESTLETSYATALAEVQAADEKVLESCRSASADRIDELERLTADAGGTASDDGGAVETTGVEGAVAAGNLAIAAHRVAAGLLSTPELRRTATGQLAAAAAEQAALRAVGGDEPIVPEPFVTGSNEKPLVASDGDDASANEGDTTTTTEEGG